MGYEKLNPSRRKAYLKPKHSARYDSHTRDLLNTHPDWLRPTKPLIERVETPWGDPIIEKQYTPPKRIDDPEYAVILGESICGRFAYTLHMQGGTYWIEELDRLLRITKRSLNYGDGELIKAAYKQGSVSWK